MARNVCRNEVKISVENFVEQLIAEVFQEDALCTTVVKDVLVIDKHSPKEQPSNVNFTDNSQDDDFEDFEGSFKSVTKASNIDSAIEFNEFKSNKFSSSTDHFSDLVKESSTASSSDDDFADFETHAPKPCTISDDDAFSDFKNNSNPTFFNEQNESNESNFANFADFNSNNDSFNDSNFMGNDFHSWSNDDDAFPKSNTESYSDEKQINVQTSISLELPDVENSVQNFSNLFTEDDDLDLSTPLLCSLLLQDYFTSISASSESKEISDAVERFWQTLSDIENSSSLSFHISDSSFSDAILKKLGIDLRNTLVKNTLPFSSYLSVLQPMKSDGKSKENSASAVENVVSEMAVPKMDFDWQTSGLMNPLEKQHLNLDFFDSQQTTILENPSSQSKLEKELFGMEESNNQLKKSSTDSQLASILAISQATTRNPDSETSEEHRIVDSLTDAQRPAPTLSLWQRFFRKTNP